MSKNSAVSHGPMEAVLQVVNEARAQGYREGYLELAYKYHVEINISEEQYQRYLEVKQQYDMDNSLQNMNNLINTTKDIMSLISCNKTE